MQNATIGNVLNIQALTPLSSKSLNPNNGNVYIKKEEVLASHKTLEIEYIIRNYNNTGGIIWTNVPNKASFSLTALKAHEEFYLSGEKIVANNNSYQYYKYITQYSFTEKEVNDDYQEGPYYCISPGPSIYLGFLGGSSSNNANNFIYITKVALY